MKNLSEEKTIKIAAFIQLTLIFMYFLAIAKKNKK